MVTLSLASGRKTGGALNPSSDTPTHLCLYRAFAPAAAILHTHSMHATAWAQACRPIPCLGTTHADHFHGAVPVTRPLRPAEIRGDYEAETGRVIVETFRTRRLDPAAIPAVLVAHHAPFAWGATPAKALENALFTAALRPAPRAIPRVLLDRHYLRKHGAAAYYGQS
jgi:L-ribulose-5-phosphate 4-epimerase